jgi:hypothetical protein
MMLALLRRIMGAEADEVIRERNEKLVQLEQQGAELDKLTERLKGAQAAAAARAKTGGQQRDNLQRSRSGDFRLKLSSET